MGFSSYSCTARVLLIALTMLASVNEGFAALGQAPSTPAVSAPAAIGARLQAIKPTERTSAYTLHEFQRENGTIVREYATPAGVVFAVAWRGPLLPDLSVLLGDYFSAFVKETERLRLVGRRGSPINMEQDGLVVRSSGRMRNFYGYAYSPKLIPAGLDIKDVLK